MPARAFDTDPLSGAVSKSSDHYPTAPIVLQKWQINSRFVAERACPIPPFTPTQSPQRYFVAHVHLYSLESIASSKVGMLHRSRSDTTFISLLMGRVLSSGLAHTFRLCTVFL